MEHKSPPEIIATSRQRYIVITTIFQPTEAVKAFASMDDCTLITVGDKKTPADWHCENAVYLSIDRQSEIGTNLHKLLPVNHYCRKMMGYLYAITQGATEIVDTDDDNIPKADWSFPESRSTFSSIDGNLGFVNIYKVFTDQPIWPRGLPLQYIMHQNNLKNRMSPKNCSVGIWQGLADEDPDVDAIYRLTNDSPCIFQSHEPITLGAGTICPFNSQNTLIYKELFPLLYLPSHVTFRFTDILRGLVAQPILWAYNYYLGFTGASVIQKRNPHDYFKDFLSEIPMYQHAEDVVDIVNSVVTASASIHDNLWNAYEQLLKKNIIEIRELDVLKAWLLDAEAADQ